MVQGFRGRKEDKCELGKRRKKRLSKEEEWLYMKIGIFVIVRFIVLVALLVKQPDKMHFILGLDGC